jgi:hypothetical protein
MLVALISACSSAIPVVSVLRACRAVYVCCSFFHAAELHILVRNNIQQARIARESCPPSPDEKVFVRWSEEEYLAEGKCARAMGKETRDLMVQTFPGFVRAAGGYVIGDNKS